MEDTSSESFWHLTYRGFEAVAPCIELMKPARALAPNSMGAAFWPWTARVLQPRPTASVRDSSGASHPT
eukprot:4917930-Lingulodinium_polyedra.AAC.1